MVYTFGMKLKEYMRENKITQIELAKSLGLTQAMISYLCKGSKKPSFDTLKKIYAFTDGQVRYEDFL